MITKNVFKKIILLTLIFTAILAYQWFGLSEYMSLASLKIHQASLNGYYQANPLAAAGIFVLVYVSATALSFPGATILTLAGGAIFGVWVGAILISFASTVGATLAFLSSRFLFRDFVQRKFRDKISKLNKGVEKDGAFYLFTLRLAPVFPFFVVNLLMGLTAIRTLTYFFVSQIGMLPATVVYVNAGTQLSQIDSLSGILTPELIGSFVLIGVFPLLAKWIIGVLKYRKYMKKFKKPRKFDYNMVVIGAGSAGLVSAYIASAVKAKVALIEKNKMGGDCLNTGCIPSKAFIKSAKILNYFARAHEYGFESLTVKYEFSKVMERIQQVIKEIAPHDSIARYTSLGVDCLQGEAKIKSPYEVEVNGRTLTTKNIVVATGASPAVPNIPGLSELAYLTSDNIWNLKNLPQRLVVLGGGSIGCELAQCFARFGAQVTIIESAPRLMMREDEDVSQIVFEKFAKEKISVRTSHKVLKVEKNSKTILCEYNGNKVQIEFDEILLAVGRKANVKGFGLETLDVEISDRGTIVADEFLRTTNYPNIFVCGDVTGPYQFTHTAAHQAWYVMVNALFSPFKTFKVDYRVIPWCTFVDPEVARVGLNELEAKEQGLEVQVTRYDISDLDRAIVDNEARGFVKILTSPGRDKILGATIVGAHAGDIIAEYVAAMKHGFGLNKILGTTHIYPTFSEANKYAAGVWKKTNAPKKILKGLAKFHEWRRSCIL